METAFAVKELFNKVFKSNLIESRAENYYINYSENKIIYLIVHSRN